MLKLPATFIAIVLALGLRGWALAQAAAVPFGAPLSRAMLGLEFTWERKVEGRLIQAVQRRPPAGSGLRRRRRQFRAIHRAVADA